MTEKCVHVKREKEVLSSKADVVSSLALPVFRSVLVEDRRQKCFFFVCHGQTPTLTSNLMAVSTRGFYCKRFDLAFKSLRSHCNLKMLERVETLLLWLSRSIKYFMLYHSLPIVLSNNENFGKPPDYFGHLSVSMPWHRSQSSQIKPCGR